MAMSFPFKSQTNPLVLVSPGFRRLGDRFQFTLRRKLKMNTTQINIFEAVGRGNSAVDVWI
jgi:hypothetical protein